MIMDRMEQMLREFTGAAGVSGAEREVFALMEKHLAGIVETGRDRLGSFIGRLARGADRPRVMLAAHMDEIGMMVSHFTGSFVRFNTLGGWWPPHLVGMPVSILTSHGDIPGVVASRSPFAMERDEREKPIKAKDLFVDVGLFGDRSPERLHIRPGDPIVPVCPFTPLAGGKTFLAKAWDDRIGCAAVVEAMRRLSRMKIPGCVYGVGTVQEEVGIRGAVTSGRSVDPDVCLAVDVSIAQDTPGAPEGNPEALGAGVSICVYDATLIPNTKLRDLVTGVADRARIPYHFSAVPYGGTDGGRIHLNESGVPTLVVGVPARHIHSAAGIIHRKDFDGAVKLLVETVRALDAKTVASLA
jgi:endoglucanase